MVQTFKLGPKRTIALPPEMFKASDRVIIVSTKDTVTIKKIAPSLRLSSLAHRKKEKAFPLREIVKEIHLSRKGK